MVSAVSGVISPWCSYTVLMNFHTASLFSRPTQSTYFAPNSDHLWIDSSGKFWKTSLAFGSSCTSLLMLGWAALQAGHSRSPNSTMVTAASDAPWTGPLAAFKSHLATAKGSAPNGTMSPVIANFWSGVTKIRKTCWPCGVLKIAVTSVKPGASADLISAIFQVKSLFQPNICFKKPSTVASVGSAEVEPAVVAGAVE